MSKAKTKTFEEFQKEFEDLLFKKFGITIGDCTDEDALRQEFKDGASPQSFVDFLGDKHDLNPLN